MDVVNLRLRLAFAKCSTYTCFTKFELRLRLVLVKCTDMVRTKFNLRLRLAFTKCSTQKTAAESDSAAAYFYLYISLWLTLL